jgi:hypothetical protein
MQRAGSSTWTQSDLPWILQFLSAATPFIGAAVRTRGLVHGKPKPLLSRGGVAGGSIPGLLMKSQWPELD